jgi:hypothetical protein
MPIAMNIGEVTSIPAISVTLLNSASAAFAITSFHWDPLGNGLCPGMKLRFGPPMTSKGGLRGGDTKRGRGVGGR